VPYGDRGAGCVRTAQRARRWIPEVRHLHTGQVQGVVRVRAVPAVRGPDRHPRIHSGQRQQTPPGLRARLCGTTRRTGAGTRTGTRTTATERGLRRGCRAERARSDREPVDRSGATCARGVASPTGRVEFAGHVAAEPQPDRDTWAV